MDAFMPFIYFSLHFSIHFIPACQSRDRQRLLITARNAYGTLRPPGQPIDCAIADCRLGSQPSALHFKGADARVCVMPACNEASRRLVHTITAERPTFSV